MRDDRWRDDRYRDIDNPHKKYYKDENNDGIPDRYQNLRKPSEEEQF